MEIVFVILDIILVLPIVGAVYSLIKGGKEIRKRMLITNGVFMAVLLTLVALNIAVKPIGTDCIKISSGLFGGVTYEETADGYHYFFRHSFINSTPIAVPDKVKLPHIVDITKLAVLYQEKDVVSSEEYTLHNGVEYEIYEGIVKISPDLIELDIYVVLIDFAAIFFFNVITWIVVIRKVYKENREVELQEGDIEDS